jgi:hypothetical protein
MPSTLSSSPLYAANCRLRALAGGGMKKGQSGKNKTGFHLQKTCCSL